MITSADSRKLIRRFLSIAMPSRIVPSACNGCGLRTCSNRLTSAESVASRNSSLRLRFLLRICERFSCSSPKNSPPRTSMTTASFGNLALVMVNRSAIGPSICGGRLSTTYQPRSSRALPTVDRPAPDMPVTMSSSCLRSSFISPLRRVEQSLSARDTPMLRNLGIQRGRDLLGQSLSDAGNFGNLVNRGQAKSLCRAKVLEQGRNPLVAEAGNL